MKYFLVPILAVLLMAVTFFCRVPLVVAQEIVLDTYEKGLSDQWEEKSFKGETRYAVTVEDGQLNFPKYLWIAARSPRCKVP